MSARDKWLGLLNLETIRGLEFGPADRPWIPASTPGIRYIDHLTTEELRKKLEKFAGDTTYKSENLCHIHFVNDGRPLREILGSWVDLDVVAASHVIEHVPDLLRWLQDLASVLRPGGLVLLAAPNKHFEFDRLRRVTNVDDVLADFLEKRKRPSPRAMIDCWMHHCHINGVQTWLDEVDPSTLSQFQTINQAFSTARSVYEEGNYRDVHVSVFTPYSFVQILRELTTLEMFPFELVELEPEGAEFFVMLKSCEAPDDVQGRLAILDEVAERLTFVVDDYYSSEYVVKGARRPTNPVEDELREQLERAQADLARATGELERMKGSASWKMTEPLRKVRSRLR